MKKRFKPILINAIIFITAVVLFAIFRPYFYILFGSYLKVPFYYHILIFLASYFIVVLLHELAHAVAFLIKGIKPKMILVLMFLFYKDTRWHLKINPKLMVLGGGMVMPNFHAIHSQKDIDYLKKATAFSLITAPTFTVVFASLLLLTNLIFFYDTPLTVFAFYIALFSAFFTYTSTLSAQGIYGDFVAHKRINTDPMFALSIVTQFVDDLNPFLIDEMRKRLFEHIPSDFSIHLLNFYQVLLNKGIYEDSEIDELLLEKTRVLAKSSVIGRRIARQYQQPLILQQAILYLYRCQEDELVDRLMVLFEAELDRVKTKQPVKQYYMKQTNHLLNRIDASEYLNDTRPFHLGLMDLIVSNIPEYQADEKAHLKPIERFEKKEMIHLDNEELM